VPSLDPWVSPFITTGATAVNGAYGAAVDGSGFVYVADRGNNRIQVFTTAGTPSFKFGASGAGNGQFATPRGVALDRSGNAMYVADTLNNRVQQFTSAGVFVRKWGSAGSASGQFNGPSGIAVDDSGNVYVADTGNHRIQKFTSAGVFTAAWGAQGSGDGQFDSPIALALDAGGNVFVADTNNDRVQKFSGTGTFVAKWGGTGAGHGQFNHPYGIGIDGVGNILVADSGNNRIERYSGAGVFLDSFGGAGAGPGQFNFPIGLAADTQNVFVVDWGNNRVHRFTGEATAAVPGPVPVAGSFGDGCSDTHTASATLTDASKSAPLVPVLTQSLGVNEGTALISGGVDVTAPGVYMVSESVCDSSANCAQATVNRAGHNPVVVVYDPSGPGVTGSGTINSQAGSFGRLPDLAGTASFAFKAFPNKGTPVPSGSLTFAFPAVSPVVTFDGISQPRWLQSSAARAQVKVGGQCHILSVLTQCTALLTAIDGDQIGGGGLDRFRMKLTGARGAVLYDSGLGAADSAAPDGVTSDPASSIVIAKYDSFTVLTSSQPAGAAGSTVTITGTVSSTSGIPNGTIRFTEGAIVLATLPLDAAGKASFAYGPMSPGAHTITGSYLGTTVFGKSAGTLAQGARAATVTALVSSLPVSTVGQTIKLTATVTSGFGVPAGTVQFFDGGATFGGPVALNAQGQASVNYWSLQGGPHTLSATFAATASFATSSASIQQTVTKLPTVTSVKITPSPSLLRQSVTITATVTNLGLNILPTGVLTMYDTFKGVTSQLAVDVLDAKGKFTFSTPNLGVGVHTIAAVYGGDEKYTGSQAQADQTVGLFVTQWGTVGSQDGQFLSPIAIDADPGGNVFVLDAGNKRVQKFSSDGRFMAWGKVGQLFAPSGLAVDSAGNVWVADTIAQQVQKFNSKGALVGGVYFRTISASSYPGPIAVTPDGFVYVAELTGRIWKCTSDNACTIAWAGPVAGLGLTVGGMFADGLGNLFVSDTDNQRIVKFGPSGVVAVWGPPPGAGAVWSPRGLHADAAGNIFVADGYSSVIEKYSPSGDFLYRWGGYFNGPADVAVDPFGYIYVVDQGNARVEKFVAP
jgi:sugar lactone lactonase YvrE